MFTRKPPKPLFEGAAEVRFVPGGVEVVPPKDAVIPPGYSMETELNLRRLAQSDTRPMARYRVVPTKGLWNRYLRWRFPWRRA